MTIIRDLSIVPFGDYGWLASFENTADQISGALAANHAAQKLLNSGKFIDVTPAIASIAIRFNPETLAADDAKEMLHRAIEGAASDKTPAPRAHIDIPVLYGGEAGPDFDWLCAHAGFTAEKLIAAHTNAPYRVAMLGFAPGFAYLGPLAKPLQAPRLAEPRQSVPQGSVGVAGAFTGVYALSSPGGWRIIGRTPKRLFNKHARDPFVIRAGDEVRFSPITEEEFARLEATP